MLLAIRDRPGSAQREIGERFGVTGGNVSMLVSKLTWAGWVRREASGAANRIWLTDVGAELVALLEPQQQEFLLDRYRALSADELGEMHRLADRTFKGLPPPS
ncbi:MarR family winged helix-turn-helix transcriptional regulator [Nakamurella sp. GG22]